MAPHTSSANPQVETPNGAPAFTTYSVTFTCTDASGKQTEPPARCSCRKPGKDA